MVDEKEAVSDAEFFADTLAGKTEEAKAEPAAPEAEAKPEGEQPRDEHGRFVQKDGDGGDRQAETVATEEQPKTVQEQRQEPDHRIPLTELLNEREKRQKAEQERDENSRNYQALQRRLASLERKPEPEPDLLENPQGFAQTLEQRITRQFQARFLNASFEEAHEEHKEAFEKAYGALVQLTEAGDTATRDRIVNSGNPGRALMRWHAEREAVREIGGDLGSYRQKLLDDAMKDPEFRKKAMEAWKAEAGDRPSTVTQLPSLNRQTAARRTEIDTEQDDESYFKSLPRLNRSG